MTCVTFPLYLGGAECISIIHGLVIISLAQDIEATIHCAEWLSMVGGSSSGDQRMRYYLNIESVFSLLILYQGDDYGF